MRALFSGVTGIRSHQVRMDVISNNIANVNTTGFKASRATFQDLFSQTLSQGSSATAPQQVGLGVALGATEMNMGMGGLQLTGRDLDLALEGPGFFVLKSGTQMVYSRAGNFDWDADGYLVNPGTGQRVQGWTADNNGNVTSTDKAFMTDLRVVRGDAAMAQPTANATFGGNLDAGAANASTYATTFVAYDTLGRTHTMTATFTKSATTNQWTYTLAAPTGVTLSGGTGTLGFDNTGVLTSGTTGTATITPPGAAAQTINLDFKSLTQAYAGTAGSTALVRKADGNPMGVLENVTFDASGVVYGVYSNGFRRGIGQVGVALFPNPNGVMKLGGSTFGESPASGQPQMGKAGMNGRGRVVPGNLEMSNVDLSSEFTNMIMTQRGFQANTRIISSADEMLQDLVNLRR